MKSKCNAGLYFLLILLATISLVYYVAGALAMREEFFHAGRYASDPFDLEDNGQTLTGIDSAAKSAGLAKGDRLLALNGIPFTGYAQIHDLLRQATPGTIVKVSVRTPAGALQTARLRLADRQGPDFSFGGYLTFLLPVLGVPLLGLIVGYWVVAARPRDLNAWLVLVLLAFPETAYGNLDWRFWPGHWYLLLGLSHELVQVFVFPALAWFGFLFPERWRVDLRWPWFKYALLLLFLCLFGLQLSFLAAQYFSVQSILLLGVVQHWADPVDSWSSLLCIFLFLAALFDKLRSASTVDARRRLRVLAIGSGLSLGLLVIIFTIVPLFGPDPHHGRWFSIVIPFLSLFPLTLAYVLIVQRAMDLRILLRMGTKYLLARATILTLELAVIVFVILRLIVPMMQRKEHPLLTLTGDVSGKGISAALIMAGLRASLRGLLLDGSDDLAKMMENVDRLVYEASSSSRYATFFFAAYHPGTRELRYVNAGHTHPCWSSRVETGHCILKPAVPWSGCSPLPVMKSTA